MGQGLNDDIDFGKNPPLKKAKKKLKYFWCLKSEVPENRKVPLVINKNSPIHFVGSEDSVIANFTQFAKDKNILNTIEYGIVKCDDLSDNDSEYKLKILRVNDLILPPVLDLVDGMSVIGMDPSSYKNCGWAVVRFKDNKIQLVEKFTQVFETKPGFEVEPWNNYHRFREEYDLMKRMIEKHKPSYLCLERSMGGGLTFVRGNLGETVGVAKLCAIDNGMKVFETSPAHLKKQVTGHGQAQKNSIMNNIAAYFGLDKTGVEHECDAVAMCISYFIDAGWTGYEIPVPCDGTKKKKKTKKGKVQKAA